MNHKLVIKIALAMVVIYLVTVLVFPTLFGPSEKPVLPEVTGPHAAAPAPVVIPNTSPSGSH